MPSTVDHLDIVVFLQEQPLTPNGIRVYNCGKIQQMKSAGSGFGHVVDCRGRKIAHVGWQDAQSVPDTLLFDAADAILCCVVDGKYLAVVFILFSQYRFHLKLDCVGLQDAQDGRKGDTLAIFLFRAYICRSFLWNACGFFVIPVALLLDKTIDGLVPRTTQQNTKGRNRKPTLRLRGHRIVVHIGVPVNCRTCSV